MAGKKLTYETPIMVRLEPAYLDPAERDAAVNRVVERMPNTATTGLTMDEIMALTPGE